MARAPGRNKAKRPRRWRGAREVQTRCWRRTGCAKSVCVRVSTRVCLCTFAAIGTIVKCLSGHGASAANSRASQHWLCHACHAAPTNALFHVLRCFPNQHKCAHQRLVACAQQRSAPHKADMLFGPLWAISR